MSANSKIIYLSLCIIIIGIITLIFTSELTTPLEIRTGEINESLIGKTISVCGYTNEIRRSQKVIFFEIGEVKKIDAVMFPPFPKNTRDIQNGRKLKITGELKKYKSKLEIIVSEVDFC